MWMYVIVKGQYQVVYFVDGMETVVGQTFDTIREAKEEIAWLETLTKFWKMMMRT